VTAPAAGTSTYALLTDGSTVEIRHAGPQDAAAVREMYAGMSPDSIYRRFFSVSPRAGEQEARRLCREPGPDHAALLAWLGGRLVGVASYEPTSRPGVAEIAFAVPDDMHRRGIATLLLEHLVSLARQRQLRAFIAETLWDNAAMLRVFADAGLPVQRHLSGGVVSLTFPLPGSGADESLDGYLETVARRESRADVASLRHVLRPASVAVVGVSRRPGTVGRAILRNLVTAGYRGRMYAVNPNAAALEGVPCVASVADLPEPVDLAVIAVPPPAVPGVAEECGQRGVRGLTVITAGMGREGADLLAICRRHGMRLVGPNCFGVSVPEIGLNATFAAARPAPGVAGLVVQSGGVGLALLEQLSRLGIGVSSFASVGDKYDVSVNDLLTWWAQDGVTRLAVLYVESFGSPRKFGRTARRVGRRMPVLTVVGGRSAGSPAAAGYVTAVPANSIAAVPARPGAAAPAGSIAAVPARPGAAAQAGSVAAAPARPGAAAQAGSVAAVPARPGAAAQAGSVAAVPAASLAAVPAGSVAATATPLATQAALFGQAGVIVTTSFGELTEAAAQLACQPLPAGNRVAIITNAAAGAAVLTADACADNGLHVARLSTATRDRLLRLLPQGATADGPVDTTAPVGADAFRSCLEEAAADDGVDAVLAVVVPTAVSDLCPAIATAAISKPAAAVLLGQAESVRLLMPEPAPPESPPVPTGHAPPGLPPVPTGHAPPEPPDERPPEPSAELPPATLAPQTPNGLVPGLPAYAYPESAARALGHAARYRAWRERPSGRVPELPGLRATDARELIAGFLARNPVGGQLPRDQAAALLSCYQIPVIAELPAISAEEAVQAAAELGGRVVLKAEAGDRAHKTDAGAVKLDLSTPSEVSEAYRALTGSGLPRVRVQPMIADGVDVLAGVVQEPVLGPIVIFGLGGATAEVLGGPAARLTPLTDVDADELIHAVQGAPLLLGRDGVPPVDVGALAGTLLRISRLADDLPEVTELDLNPVIARPDGVDAVDVRVVVRPAEPRDPFLRRLR
jgi:acyl-CoA synthetase (NDP forming)/GNAT superfamily N-acetyltransferase